MQGLEPPVVGDEFHGQPVEQFRVGGRIAHHAEVARASHDAPAEVVLPDAVGHHAGGQRIVGRDEPAGQRRAATGGLRTCGGSGNHRLLGLEDRRKGRADPVFRLLLRVRVATVEDIRLGRCRPTLRHDERLVDGHLFLLQLLERLHLLVVVLLAIDAEQPFPVDSDRLSEVEVFSTRLATVWRGRERPDGKIWPRPRHGQALAVLALEIVEPDRHTAGLQRHGGRLRRSLSVDAVMFDDRVAIDRQP